MRHHRRPRALLGALAMILLGATLIGAPPTADALGPCNGQPSAYVLGGGQGGPNQFPRPEVVDGNPSTFMGTSSTSVSTPNPYVILDLHCERLVTGIHRTLTNPGLQARGTQHRGSRGEELFFSSDGRSWTRLTNAMTTGWSGFPFVGGAWTETTYGRSPALTLVPLQTRYLRFSWENDPDDRLNEIEVISSAVPPPPPRPGVSLGCEPTMVACLAQASGGSGSGYTFDWTPQSNLVITRVSSGSTSSSMIGVCTEATGTYSVRVKVTDSDGQTAVAQGGGWCPGAEGGGGGENPIQPK